MKKMLLIAVTLVTIVGLISMYVFREDSSDPAANGN